MPAFQLTSDLLQRACQRSGFPVPDTQLVFFGIRGAVPTAGDWGGFATGHELAFASIDHQAMRCTIGQWKPGEGTLAVHLGSTVPGSKSIEVARSKGGAGANMLLPGRYDHVKGMHKPTTDGGHRAFRQDSFAPVRRTANNLTYDNFDRIDLGKGTGSFVWDNIHAAYSTSSGRFSSAGCQVVCGQPKSRKRGWADETGPWRHFINVAYGEFEGQARFTYLLFDAADIAALLNDADAGLTQIVRFGSVGAAAQAVQEALIAGGYLNGPADGDFGRLSLQALARFQSERLPPDQVDGVCGPATARLLGVGLPGIDGPAPPAPPRNDIADQSVREMEDDSDMVKAMLTTTGPKQVQYEATAALTDETATQSAPETVTDNLAVIQAQLDRLSALYPELTPVNGALGPLLGRLLNGKKTIIGIVGAVLATIGVNSATGGAATDAGVLTPVVNAVLAALPVLKGTGAIFQPLFVALAAWGMLGKTEKRIAYGVPETPSAGRRHRLGMDR
jgi:hypothetical protein